MRAHGSGNSFPRVGNKPRALEMRNWFFMTWRGGLQADRELEPQLRRKAQPGIRTVCAEQRREGTACPEQEFPSNLGKHGRSAVTESLHHVACISAKRREGCHSDHRPQDASGLVQSEQIGFQYQRDYTGRWLEAGYQREMGKKGVCSCEGSG